MEREQDTVGGHVNVGLEVGVAELEGVAEAVGGVLEAGDVGVGGPAAMGEGEHARRRGRRDSRAQSGCACGSAARRYVSALVTAG